MVNTYACKKATRVSSAYMKNSKKNHAIAGRTRNDVHLEDGGLQEDGGCQREYGENHMACEHVAVKSNGKSQNADYHGEELQEPNDGGNRCRYARRAQRLEVMEEAKLLQAPEVEVDKGNSSQCPGDGDGAIAAFAPGMRPIMLAVRMKKNSVARKGTCFLKPSPITSAPTPSEMKL